MIGRNGEGKMKDRVEGFLKVARQRVKEDTDNIREFNDLCGSLTSLIKDKELQDYLLVEYMKITDEAEIQKWDEDFLRVIANDEPTPKALTTGLGSNALWSSSNQSTASPNTMLTSASMHQAARDILKSQIDAEFKKDYAKIQMKDRYKTP